jgi:hypothetical protein
LSTVNVNKLSHRPALLVGREKSSLFQRLKPFEANKLAALGARDRYWNAECWRDADVFLQGPTALTEPSPSWQPIIGCACPALQEGGNWPSGLPIAWVREPMHV